MCLLAAPMTATLAAEDDAGAPVTVEVSGVDGKLLENVRAFLSIVEAAEGGLLARVNPRQSAPALSSDEVRRRHRRAPEEIRQALVPFGYYRVQVDAELEARDGRWHARYRIDKGPPTLLDTVEIDVRGEGRDHPAVRRALSRIALEPGERLVHARYESAKSGLYEAAYDNGFLEAEWRTHRIRVGPDRAWADISLTLDTGPRFYFGEVTIEQDILDPSFVRRFVPFEAGDAYDVRELLELQLILADSDYFGRVEIHADQDRAGADHRVPVTVVTEPKKSQRYSVGAGYATDTGPRLSFGATLRRLNRAGHRLHFDLEVSGINQTLAATYEVPVANVATDALRFTASAQQEEVGDAETDQFAVGVSRIETWLGLRRRLYIAVQRENFHFGSGPEQQSDLLYPGITLERKRVDDLQYPRHAYRIRADLRGGMDSVFSDTSFVRAELTGRWVRGLGDRTRFLLHGAIGGLSVDSFTALPPTQRFFTGGDRSVRGYAFEEIGPRNADGDVIGGRYMVLASMELEHLFVGNYGAAVFVDAGDAFDDSPELSLGAGIGFRWRSPIGMVRLDFAHPFDDPDTNVRFHLSIGGIL